MNNLTKNLINIYQAQVADCGETTDKFDVHKKIIDNIKNFIFSHDTIENHLMVRKLYTTL